MKLSLSFFLYFIIYTVSAQNFIISSIGRLKGVSSNSSAFVISNSSNCLNAYSGIALFETPKNNGKFEITCFVNYEFNKLGLVFYPNPTRVISHVRFIKIPPLDEIFSISIWSIQGNLLLSQKESGYNLYNGIELNLNKLIPGSYILNIETSRFFDTIKFIKTF
jgi:hypothetical protein